MSEESFRIIGEYMHVEGAQGSRRLWWIRRATQRATLIAVTDVSCMQELMPNLCSLSFILKYSKGSDRIVIAGTFAEGSRSADAYRGKLIGPVAIHLILLKVNKL